MLRHWRTTAVVLLLALVVCGCSLFDYGRTTLPPPVPEVVLHDTFEDGDASGWTGRGVTVSVSDAVAHEGTYSVYVTNRSANWTGVQKDIAPYIQKGPVYTFSVWVRVDDSVEAESVPFKLSIERRRAGQQSSVFLNVDEKTVPKGQWVQLIGEKDWVAIAGDASETTVPELLVLYVETPNAIPAGPSFYIDDAMITALGK